MWIKQGLSDYENWLLCCERWGTIAFLLTGYHPSDELRDDCRKILYIAFHDVIPGTGMDEGYEEVRHYLDAFRKTPTLGPRIYAMIVEEESERGGVEGDVIVFNSRLSFR